MSARVHAFVVAAALAAAFIACKPKAEVEEGGAARGRYTAINVQGGGTISGRVTIAPVPHVPPLEVTHDNDVCGTTKPSPRLVLGADGSVGNAVVYLVDIRKGAALAQPSQAFRLSQHLCMYEPHVLVLPAGSTLAVSNDDVNVLHNVHMLMGDTTVFNQAQPMQGQVNTIVLQRPGVMHLRCDAGHVWMSGWIWVTEHPYYRLTDTSGMFTLGNIPPGTYTLACWHEGWHATERRDAQGDITSYEYDAPAEQRVTVTIDSNAAVHHDFVLPGK